MAGTAVHARPPTALARRIRSAVRDVPDFPRPGVVFRDLAGLYRDPVLSADLADAVAAAWTGRATAVVGVDARGFLLGATVAERLAVPLVLARKPGKLPGEVRTVSYDLEYGSTSLAIRTDDLPLLGSALVVDDLLATGGTLAAVDRLVAAGGGAVAGFAVAVELVELGGAAVVGADRLWSACAIGSDR